MVRATLGWLFLWCVVIAAASCGFEIDEDLCLTDDHCDDGEVCTLHNRCLRCSGALCPAHERCAEDTDCSSDEACASDGLCRTRCVVDAQCGVSGVCKEPVCGDPIGAPCTDYDTPCAGDECVDTDNRLSPLPAYCTQRCMPEQCPDGYECVQSLCRKIRDREVCNYPEVSGYCAGCVWEYCYYNLEECCEGQICGDVYQQIDLCDQDTTYASCMPFASPFNFAATSEELRGCIELFCNSGECLPEQ